MINAKRSSNVPVPVWKRHGWRVSSLLGEYSLGGSYLVKSARKGHNIWSRAVLLLLVPATTRQLL